MKFNYQARYKQFRNKERRFAQQAFREGMKKEAIREIIKFDWEVFRSDRIFCIHNQQMVDFVEEAQRTDGMNPLQGRFSDVLTEEDRYLEDTIEDIILNLDDKVTHRVIQDLTDDQKHLLYEIAILKKRPGEIAEKAGTSCAAVTQRMERIRKKIKKFSSDR